MRPISSQKTYIRPSSLVGSNSVACRPGETNRSDNDGCNATTRNSRDSLVVPLALSISNLRMTPEKQRHHSSIEIPLPSLSSKGAISSKAACSTDRVVENGANNYLKKQTKIASLKSGMRNFIHKENAEKGNVTHGSSSRRRPLACGSGEEAVHISGLDNLGNTCFMNCTLQCLLSCPRLTEYFREEKYKGDIRNSESEKVQIAKAFADLLRRTRGKGAPLACDGQSISPTHLKDLVAKDESHYFNDSLQDILSRNLQRNRFSKFSSIVVSDEEFNHFSTTQQSRYMWKKNLACGNNSVVTDTFGGQLQSTIECSECGHVSRCYDPFLDLSLPIPTKKNGEPVPSCKLEDCLKEYTREEILCNDKMIHYEKCGDRKPCIKKLQIMRRPHILLLHLKRFCHTKDEVRKLSTAISFPLTGLHLDRFLSPDSEYAAKSVHERYDLYAMIDHIGSMSYGHYTATCLSSIDRCFYKLDDEQVERLSSKNQSHIGKHSSTVYVLSYKLVREP